MTRSAALSALAELVAAEPVRAVMDVHAQVRGEPRRLPLPVPHQRHRADQQRRDWLGVIAASCFRQQCKHLYRFAESHVVREDCAEAAGCRGRTARPGRVPGRGAARRGTRPGWGPGRAGVRPGRRAGRRASRRRRRATTGRSSSALAQPLAQRAPPRSMVPDRLRSRNFSAACRCRSSSSTHWPRSRTRGTLSRASSSSSSGSRDSSPTARSYRKSTRSLSPNLDSVAARPRPRSACVRVVIFRPSRALRTQSGSSTPKPAPDSSGPVCCRNRNAPSVSSVTASGAGSSQPVVELGEQPGGRAEPGQQVLLRVPDPGRGPAARRARPTRCRPRSSSRLGSSVDCSANSTAHGARSAAAPAAPSAGVRGSVRGLRFGGLDQAEAGADRPDRDLGRGAPSARSAASSAASASSSGVATGTCASAPVSAVGPAFGDRHPGRAAAAPRGQQRERRARGRAWPGPRRRPARRAPRSDT